MKPFIGRGLLALCLSVINSTVMANSKLVLNKSSLQLLLMPEEHFRERWDRGCSDWRDLLADAGSKETLAIQFERGEGQYTLRGQARLRPEGAETVQDLVKSLEQILSYSNGYKDWIFPGINEHPQKGSSYFVELHDLKVEARQPTHIFLSGPFDFKVVSIVVKGMSTIELKWDVGTQLKCVQPPSVEPLVSAAPVWRYRMFPRPDILEWMIGELTIFQRGGDKVDIQTRFVMRPSPLVYSLMPAKLIENELRLRAQRVFQNVIETRRKRVWDSYKASQAEYPLKTKVQNPKSESSR